MEHFDLPEPLGRKLGFIAREIGLTEEACAREAILRFIEDYEDVRDAEDILGNADRKTYTTDEVRAFIHRDKH